MAINDVETCEDTCVHMDRLDKVRAGLPDEDELYDLAELFKVFGDSTRIRILYVLFQSELCVCDLAEALQMTQSAISHQLKILKLLLDDAELFSQRDDGTVERVVLHMLPDLIEGEADFLHDADRIEVIELTRTVVTVTVLRIHPGR